MSDYSSRLREQLAAYKRLKLVGIGNRVASGEPAAYPHVLDRDSYRGNILPFIRERFWSWFDAQGEVTALHASFHHLDSIQAMAFNLFFPFVSEGKVDRRLLKVLGLAEGDYRGHFGKVLDTTEETTFDFYMEAASGEKIFFDAYLAEDAFGSCADDEPHREKLERHYLPHLQGHVDQKWLAPTTFFGHYQVMRKLSYLGRHPDSGIVFILPKANERLKDAEENLKHIVSKTLAPRVAILYLEYLVERILAATADDASLTAHFLELRDRYVCL